MPLTKEEKSLIAIFRGSEYHQDKVVVELVDRLVAENEKLSAKCERFDEAIRHDALTIVDGAMEERRLQNQLDAIKKAWGETLVKYNSVAHHFSFVCDEAIELGDAIEALDKLIGGEK